MQTYTQTFAANTTWQSNTPGRYFNVLSCTNNVTVRLFLNGKKLDLGDIKNLGAGLEIFDVQFDRVEVDVTGPDTVTIGIGNGQARYTRTFTTITNNRQPVSANYVLTAPAVGVASSQLVAANANRQYLLIQNQHATGTLWITFGAGPAVAGAGSLKIGPGGYIEFAGTQSAQAVQVIGDVANAAVTVCEG
jgi:hypothetical protein